ncbi:MAG: DNA helicase RecQ, partial [Candidatus Margulisiibacteriota bacterium]
KINLEDSLKAAFGYNNFLPYQKEIISHILDQEDVLGILPTGSGKSLCYQLPAVLMPGTAIVVSPLISLMQDQVASLDKQGIKAAFLNSSLDGWEINRLLQSIDQYKLLYIAPERFASKHFVEKLKQSKISFFVVDEAHCISQWGHSFRPEYRQLSILKTEFAGKPIAAFTATATPEVAQDIAGQLMPGTSRTIQGSFDRPNLTIRINDKINMNEQLLTFLNHNKDRSGIIYAATRKLVDQTHQLLSEQGFSVEKYHAGLAQNERNRAHRLFMNDDVRTMVATVAFGMGIHKPDVRFVFHLNMPKNVEQYYQEIGRAGRDGLPAECLMLYSAQDLVLQKRLLEDVPDEAVRAQLRRKTEQMFALCGSLNCRRAEILHYFSEDYGKEKCQGCDNCLDKIDLVDGTIIARKILSCVRQLQGRFGINYVANVLSGSKRKEIFSNDHDRISSYDQLNDCSRRDIQHYIFSLINMGYLLVTDGQYPLLQLTTKSGEILQYNKQIDFRKKIHTNSRLKEIDFADYDKDLFNELVILRKEIANANNVPPFVVFHDRTLIEMSYYFPQNGEQLSGINGVGPQKVSQYGEKFMAAIRAYCQKKGLSSRIPQRKFKTQKEKNTITDTIIQTHNLLKSRKSIQEIAQMRSLAVSTISSHVAVLIEHGKYDDIQALLSPEKIKQIQAAIERVGDNTLSPIKAELGDDFTWDELRLAVAYHKYNKQTVK